MKECKVCGGKVPRGRHKHGGRHCSQKCEIAENGYGHNTFSKTDYKVAADLLTAWKPDPLEPIHHVISAKPIPIFSDLHFPLVSAPWVEQGLRCASQWESDILILNGDVMDLNEISRHMGHYYRRRKELSDDFDSTEAFLRLVCPMFKEVVWLSGNHCIQRLIQVFRGELGAQRILSMLGQYENLRVTSRSFIDVNNNIRVCHPRQYSRVRGALAQRLAQRWQKHIVTGHEHHAAKGFSPCGKFQAVAVPCMADTQAQDYVRNELNDFPEPINGFGAIFGEHIEVFTKHTNWKVYGLPDAEL